MIGRIAGILISKNPPQVMLEAGGVGYEIDVPMSTFYHLPATGESAVLLTHLVVREDAHVLYGFASEGERSTFRQLIRISGVGARTALSVLSGMSVADLAHAVATQDTSCLTKVPGIGKKTAERLLLELKGKLADALPQASGGASVAGSTNNDVLNALLALGYNEREAHAALRHLTPELSVAEGIRAALKVLAKA